MTSLDVHVYQTRDGLYRARCSGGGVTAYGVSRDDVSEAAASAIRLHGCALTRPRQTPARGSSSGVEHHTSTPLAPRGDGTSSRSRATTSRVAPGLTRPDGDGEEAFPIGPRIGSAAAAVGEDTVLRGAAEAEDLSDSHVPQGARATGIAGGT